MNLFFKDLKIVELANVLAGPAVGLFFAELGANVIKIENKRTGGDVTRSWRVPVEDPSASSSAGEIFPTSDGKQMVLAIGNDLQFKKLCNVLNRKDLADDTRFSNNTKRVMNRLELFIHIKEMILTWDSALLLLKLIEQDVPAGIIRSVKEVFENDSSRSLVLEDNENGYISKRVRTVIFKITD